MTRPTRNTYTVPDVSGTLRVAPTARDIVALLGALAIAVVIAMGLGGCVNAAIHDTAVKLHAQIEALHETSDPPVRSTPEQVDLWHAAWAQALTSSARLVEVSR